MADSRGRVYHEPKGDPCPCGVENSKHRPDTRTNRPNRPNRPDTRTWAERGRKDTRKNRPSRPDTRTWAERGRKDTRKNRPSRKDTRKRTGAPNVTFIGIDGEGQGRADHKYVLLAASTESGDKEWYVEANPGIGRLTTTECLDLILSLPTRQTKIFSYSFNYDLTKMLMDLDNESLFFLFRPELRKGFFGPTSIEWCPSCRRDEDGNWDCTCGESYWLNLQGTKFSVKKGNKRVVIWDLFKFFQAKFVGALEDWKVGTPELWKRMTIMKDQRADFDKISRQEVINYCLEETRCMGQLARKLVEAHESQDLKLRTYYGAGSSGAAMLTAMDIKSKLAPTMPEMKEAVASAFFGGRFENSVIGAIREPLESLDISSAYVYQLAFLPCLQHGSWSHTTKRKDIEKAQAQSGALIRYSLGPAEEAGDIGKSWGPFPFRGKDGSISFPIESGGGWIWLDEFLAGERLFANVRFEEAWVYSSNCNCKPFGRIPEYYNLRVKIGKEGPGIVIKLGMNSCYGKLAQSLGNAIFQSWIWAGMITSGCRAQLLEVLGLHKDPANCLMFATDGILTRERNLVMPKPLDTKTGTTKPLGGWERKDCPKGVFIARPGIYFPLEPTIEEIKQVRARGVGRSVVLEHWKTILDTWEKDGVDGIATVANVTRFCGAKTSISCSHSVTKFKRARGRGTKPAYGQWRSREVALTFNPLPKRQAVNPDGITLEVRRFPFDLASTPYRKAIGERSQDAKEMKAAAQELGEQPDGDLTVYEEV